MRVAEKKKNTAKVAKKVVKTPTTQSSCSSGSQKTKILKIGDHRKATIQPSVDVMKHSCCKHSKYQVGSSILCEDGQIFTGVNVESDTYGLTVCAERNALYKALSEGQRKFVHMACSTLDGGLSCGACRQLLAEYCPPNMQIVFTNNTGKVIRQTTIQEMMPKPFLFDSSSGKSKKK